ncbi:OLC1v1028102C1 [Oldenlandia corymbosa var. corymbosa]|uniref:OLC1v1028102C1 n=1 Tax=Oldenlandia corymbosa var. corymbosa TaxID=529605 RepID=A0AAV1CDC4_OLDCO|nr:OLC1v1028102C1 [Oldenlandia corymbosa var. corymbosa]
MGKSTSQNKPITTAVISISLRSEEKTPSATSSVKIIKDVGGGVDLERCQQRYLEQRG